MKVKIRCFIKISLLLLFIFNDQYLFSQITPAQQEMATNMIKYWYYRDRLKYFVVPATGPIVYEGESDIACVRNSWANSYYGGNLENLDYGQHGKYTGFYLGTLATEYYLLKQNNQTKDQEKTASELYAALLNYEYEMDGAAEPYWGYNYSSSINGFFIRDNIPCDFLNPTNPDLALLNKNLTVTNSLWDNNSHKFGNFPRGHPGYAYYSYNGSCPAPVTNIPQAMSQDEAIFIMMGLALTMRLADDNTYPDGHYYPCQSTALNLFKLLVKYIINNPSIIGPKDYHIYEPNGYKIPMSQGGDAYFFGKGFEQASYNLTGIPYPDHWIQKVYWNSMPTFGVPWPEDNLDLVLNLAAMGDSWHHTGDKLASMYQSTHWDFYTFYTLLWNVLQSKSCVDNTLQMQVLLHSLAQLDVAPCEGPYSYPGGYYSENGWSATYKWCKDIIAQFSGDGYYGNFFGCDYMLLYNLLHIVNLGKPNTPDYVNYIDRTLAGVVTSPVQFIAFNSITSTQEIDNINTPWVIYKAGNYIELQPGFEVVDGSYFHAYISPISCADYSSSSGSESGSAISDTVGADYPNNMYTPYYDSLISVPQTPYPLSVETDTINDDTLTLTCPVDTMYFNGINDDTVGDTYSYFWNFGNRQISSIKSPKVYYTPGTYNFMLIITDTTGVKDTMKQVIVVPNCLDKTNGSSRGANPQTPPPNNSLPPIDNSTIQIIPNPNNGNMVVAYTIPVNESGVINLYDMFSKEVASYPLIGGKNSFNISETNIDKGVYLYRAIAGGQLISTGKIVVIK